MTVPSRSDCCLPNKLESSSPSARLSVLSGLADSLNRSWACADLQPAVACDHRGRNQDDRHCSAAPCWTAKHRTNVAENQQGNEHGKHSMESDCIRKDSGASASMLVGIRTCRRDIMSGRQENQHVKHRRVLQSKHDADRIGRVRVGGKVPHATDPCMASCSDRRRSIELKPCLWVPIEARPRRPPSPSSVARWLLCLLGH